MQGKSLHKIRPSSSSSSETVTCNISTLECPICMSLLYKPIIVNCGHSFCCHCMLDLSQSSISICPLCRLDLGSPHTWRLNLLLQSILLECFPSEYHLRQNDRPHQLDSLSLFLRSLSPTPTTSSSSSSSTPDLYDFLDTFESEDEEDEEHEEQELNRRESENENGVQTLRLRLREPVERRERDFVEGEKILETLRNLLWVVWREDEVGVRRGDDGSWEKVSKPVLRGILRQNYDTASVAVATAKSILVLLEVLRGHLV